MVSIKIDLKKKDFIWISLVIVLIGVGFVISLGSDNYLVHGHDAGELDVSGGGGSGATYVSPWQSISKGGSVTFNHGLGTDELSIQVQFRNAAGVISSGYSNDYAGSGYGVDVYAVTATQIKVSGGNADLRFWRSDGKMAAGASPAEVRVIATTNSVSAGGSGSVYTGQESVTFPNGMIMKSGESGSTGTVTIDFDTPFPGGLKSVIAQPIGNVGGSLSHGEEIHSSDEDGFVYGIHGNYDGFYWTAIGW